MSGLLRRGLGLRVPALEPLDAATGVDELLLARVEGVTLGAQLHAQRWDRRAGHELVATRAVHLALDVVRVNSGLHIGPVYETPSEGETAAGKGFIPPRRSRPEQSVKGCEMER